MNEIVVIPREIFEFMWQRSQDSEETGFFLIGISWRNKYIIYDAIEFQYAHRSSTFVSHVPYMKNILLLSLVPMQKLLGNAHSHPFSNIPSPSAVDLTTWQAYNEGIFLIIGKNDFVCFRYYENTLKQLSVEIRSLLQEEKPKIINIKRWKIVVTCGMSIQELKFYLPQELSKLIAREVKLSKVIFTKNRKKLVLPNYIDVIHNYALYRIYFHKREEAKKKLEALFGNYYPRLQ